MSDLALPAPSLPVELETMVIRSIRLVSRNVEGLITLAALPVLLMLMFVYLFGGAISTGTHYVNFVAPGVLLVCLGFGAASTAVSVANDLSSGIIERFRSLDVRGETLIAGHVVASVIRNLASAVVVFGVAFAIGYRSPANPGQWLAAIGIIALFVVALSWLAAAIGILAHSPEAANGVSFLVSFLAYPSSALVPVRTMPHWLQGFARDQPISTVIDSVRGLLLGGPVAGHAVAAVVWSLGIIVVSAGLSGLFFRLRVR
jgi:ABC-2 type transport system permease protein